MTCGAAQALIAAAAATRYGMLEARIGTSSDTTADSSADGAARRARKPPEPGRGTQKREDREVRQERRRHGNRRFEVPEDPLSEASFDLTAIG
jgi:hypothetical protein